MGGGAVRARNSILFIKDWVFRLAVTGLAQALIQVTNMVSGMMVIRSLGTNQYAYYTIAYSILGTLNVLCDSGISSGVMAQGGKVWNDPIKLGKVYREGLRLRYRFAIVGLLACVPILSYLLRKQGASVLEIVLINLALVPSFIGGLTGQLLEISLKLHQRIKDLQIIQVSASAGRFGLLAAFLFALPYAAFAIALTGIPQVWANLRLIKKSAGLLKLTDESDSVIRGTLVVTIKKYMPQAVYYAFSGQITIWLISIFGDTRSIAEIGVSGRLANILSIVGAIVGIIIIPRFARQERTVKRLLMWYYCSLTVVAFVCIAIILPFLIWPSLIHFVLGGNYSGIQNEVILSFYTGAVSCVSSSGFHLLSSRGHIVTPFISIGLMLAIQVALAPFCDFSSAAGVLWYGLIMAILGLIINIVYGYCALRRGTG